MITKHPEQRFVPYNPIRINGTEIGFSNQAEHVGILRSCEGNTSNLLKRFSAHRKALAAILFAGTARNHRGNLAASLQTEKTYASPVLFSGLGSLVLSKSEVNMIDHHHISTLRKLLKTHAGTPQVFVLFLSGSLPGKALLHLRQLSLFSMITRLPDNPLFSRAKHALTTYPSTGKSWFTEIRRICQLYSLPHPLVLLTNPVDKNKFKRLVKSKVTDYWEQKLRKEAAELTSVPYFKPRFMSLSSPHPIWTSCGSNPFESRKAISACRMLSGKYLTDKLQRHWTQNREGLCLLPACAPPSEGSLEHILLHCPALAQTRASLHQLSRTVAQESHLLFEIITGVLNSDNNEIVMQFILDSSVLPIVIRTTQLFGNHTRDRLLYLGRTWCYNIHRERMKQLGHFNFM